MPFEPTPVPGLLLCNDFLTKEQEIALSAAIDQEQWKSNRLGTRRVQMYGPHHDERFRVWKGAMVTPLPPYAPDVISSIVEASIEVLPEHYYLYELGNQHLTELFVNEYSPASELQFHTDHNITYEETIIGISLLSDAILRFREIGTESVEHVATLPARSCYLMTGRSRTDFQHGMVSGDCQGARRISLTFRIVNASNMLSRK